MKLSNFQATGSKMTLELDLSEEQVERIQGIAIVTNNVETGLSDHDAGPIEEYGLLLWGERTRKERPRTEEQFRG